MEYPTLVRVRCAFGIANYKRDFEHIFVVCFSGKLSAVYHAVNVIT